MVNIRKHIKKKSEPKSISLGNIYITYDDNNSYIWLNNTSSGIKIAGFQFVLNNGKSCIKNDVSITLGPELTNWHIYHNQNDTNNSFFQVLMYSGLSSNLLNLRNQDILIATINNYNAIKLHGKFYKDCVSKPKSKMPCNVVSDQNGKSLDFKYITSDNILYYGRTCNSNNMGGK